MPPNEKTLMLLPCLFTGGTEVATLETALALKSLGHDVDVVVYFNEVDAAMLNTFTSSGLSVHFLNVRRGNGVRTQWHLALALLRLLFQRRYDLIWVQYMTPTLLPLVIARLFTRKLVACVHVAASHYSNGGQRRLRWLARHWCTRLVCVSQTVANGIFGPAEGADRAGGRVVVIPNALDMRLMQNAEARDWRAEFGWPQDAVVVGFAGRLAHIKGADVLLHATALLHEQGMPVRLVLVGDGAEEAHLKALAQQLNIHSITHFAGRLARTEIYSAIKGFDIAAVPSREEGFGLSALEAMAAGVPVVASRVDALQEVVQDGVSGLLCQVDDPTDLANTATRLVLDKVFRRRMGASGIEYCNQYFDNKAYRSSISNMLYLIKI
ncbi:MAG: hypothetical protein RJB34_1253 [Pseudomonadota bacterium]|jgi:glycosyltransferase involved in cell wall biosynthesis